MQAEAVFDAGLQTHSVKLVLKRLQGRAVNKTRPKLSAAIIVKLKLLGAAARKKVRGSRRGRGFASVAAAACWDIGPQQACLVNHCSVKKRLYSVLKSMRC